MVSLLFIFFLAILDIVKKVVKNLQNKKKIAGAKRFILRYSAKNVGGISRSQARRCNVCQIQWDSEC